eukprot:CAMPEP_0206539864 /NCGR_PEP_ID=MMETSP0325_2-20121206/8664_1 /ASSEMBLY_ACC=CAM_ASM_000347 /TAXON_ID=2866 /ORGANISM="Crypthecodinium cohnii, Strain Seligo" /LENGTH=1023 /DNA_ID=CAMNT_0054037479 /DNA_START=159 /DNA_END=3226 /DNA_ORIENTATION=-
MAAAAVGFAGAAATSAGLDVFQYNRENFLDDRERRMKKEFTERKYRVIQSSLWRSDVREVVSLTEKKMSILLLVGVLLLGFNINLWTEGRLREQTPAWLTMGMEIAIAISFSFLLLAVWLAMHAAVAAQSYETRLLTQLVRLPIPSWEELEACRTAGSDFERLGRRQILRVPFLSNRSQEGLLQSLSEDAEEGLEQEELLHYNTLGRHGHIHSHNHQAGLLTASPAGLSAAAATATAAPGAAGATAAAFAAADPWGLERRADHTTELGCFYGRDCANLRHVKLIRQAAVYWQTYEAFARVSLSVGVNQLMLSITYYVIGWGLVVCNEPVAALCAVCVLVGAAYLVAAVDLTLSLFERWAFQISLAVGPVFATIAAKRFLAKDPAIPEGSELFVPLAFLSHALVVALLTVLVKVRTQENGAMLPLAFQRVLFLDVFGWVWHRHIGSPPEPSPAREVDEPSTRTGHGGLLADEERMAIASLWTDLEPEGLATRRRSLSGEWEPEFVDAPHPAAPRPASVCVDFDARGRPIPSLPVDACPPGAAQDMRHLPGAPHKSDEVNALKPSRKEFWDPVTFMPPEGRGRTNLDEFFAEWQERPEANRDPLDYKKRNAASSIRTGHDNETPGILPWMIFRSAATLSCLMWLGASTYYTLQATGILTIPLRWPVESTRTTHYSSQSIVGGKKGRSHTQALLLQSEEGLVVPSLHFPDTAESSVMVQELVKVSWPSPEFHPVALSCDTDGEIFLTTDGHSLHTAVLDDSKASRRVYRKFRFKRPGKALLTDELFAPRLKFASQSLLSSSSSSCSALAEALNGPDRIQDVLLYCHRPQLDASPVTTKHCEALVLHQQGRRLTLCPLSMSTSLDAQAAVTAVAAATSKPTSTSLELSDRWMQSLGHSQSTSASSSSSGRSKRLPESVGWLLLNQECSRAATTARDALARGCLAVGSSGGRLARLRLSDSSDAAALQPVDVFAQRRGEGTALLRDMPEGFGLQAARWQLHCQRGGAHPSVKFATDFCSSSNHVYALG